MKKLGTFIAVFLLTGAAAFATTTTKTGTHFIERGYGNSFIFVEQGVEFAVFPDGQFDFNVETYGPNFSAYANFGNVGISFNTGHSYDAYVQYDDFGAVIQIENVPIYYDYYGRIVRAGDVRMRYNNFGRVARVGGLFIHYNRYNAFSHYTGFINVYNRHYVYRPWHTYYAIPVVNLCIVYNRPYRQYYAPVRHRYYTPYRDNYRPNVSYNAGRRDSRVANTNRHSDRYIQDSKGRRDSRLADNSKNISRRSQSNVKTRESNSRQEIKGNRTTSEKTRRVETKRPVERSTTKRTVTKRSDNSRNDSGNVKRNTRTVEKRSTPAKRVVKTTPSRKTNAVNKRSSNNSKSQRVVKSTPQRKTSDRSSREVKAKRSNNRKQ